MRSARVWRLTLPAASSWTSVKRAGVAGGERAELDLELRRTEAVGLAVDERTTLPSWPLSSVPGTQRRVSPSAATTPATCARRRRGLASPKQAEEGEVARQDVDAGRRRGRSRRRCPRAASCRSSGAEVSSRDVPSPTSAGDAGRAGGVGKKHLERSLKSCTYVPAIAQRAVTSMIWLPGAKPGASAAGAPGSTRSTRMSPAAWAASATPRPASGPWRGRPAASASHRRTGDAALDRRPIRRRRALDRDGDAERRAGAARVLELAREHMQAVGQRAGREGQRRCRR